MLHFQLGSQAQPSTYVLILFNVLSPVIERSFITGLVTVCRNDRSTCKLNLSSSYNFQWLVRDDTRPTKLIEAVVSTPGTIAYGPRQTIDNWTKIGCTHPLGYRISQPFFRSTVNGPENRKKLQACFVGLSPPLISLLLLCVFFFFPSRVTNSIVARTETSPRFVNH